MFRMVIIHVFNMDHWANDRASSVNTHGLCFILFEHESCQGHSFKVAPGTSCHSNFPSCNFNDVTSSYKIFPFLKERVIGF